MDIKRSAGFQLHVVDRLMRIPYAELYLAIAAACSIVVSLVICSDGGMDLSQVLDVLHSKFIMLALFGVVFAMGGWWTVRTWRRLWRRGRSPWERAVYDYGVRGFGFTVAIALIVIFVSMNWQSDSGESRGLLALGGAIAATVFGTPIALNLGFFWGSAFAAIVGAKKDPDIEKGEPPLVARPPQT